jgi:hypothetical protein
MSKNSWVINSITVASGKSGKTPGRNLQTCTVVNLRNNLVVINQSISNFLRVYFFYTVLGDQHYSILIDRLFERNFFFNSSRILKYVRRLKTDGFTGLARTMQTSFSTYR